MAFFTTSPSIYASPILIVEDNEINRVFIEKALRARGFNNLLAVDDAKAALKKIGQFKPELVILDIMMPEIDGFECCRRIREMPEYSDLPILIQTAITEPKLRVKAFEEGASDFVSKPIYPDELHARVMVHLERRLLLKDLQLYKSRVQIELESARQLQYAILPQPLEIQALNKQCNLDIVAHFEPSSEIGGDFWGTKALFPHQVALWMVDFSGHGVASALNAFRLQAYLKEHSKLAARPGEYLSHLNDKLLHLLLRGQFATMFYGIIDIHGNKLLYASACSPHPIIIRGDTGRAEMIDGTGKPLGISLHTYAQQEIDFHEGDTLLLYSDALIETPNSKGEYLTEEEIIKLLNQHAGSDARQICDMLTSALKQHSHIASLDDLTIAVYRRAGTA